jgi:putative membrane protein
MDMMVKDHNKTIADFQKASNDAKDADLKGWAGKTLPTLQMHLDSAQAINKAKM